MEIIIIRHGQAAPFTGDAGDSLRPLTKKGHADTTRLGARLHSAGLVPDRIFSSPYVRTRETTANIAASFPGSSVHFTERLVPYAGAEELAAWVRRESGRVFLVSHLPLVAATAGVLLECSPHTVVMVPGTALHLTVSGPDTPAALLGMLQPDHTR